MFGRQSWRRRKRLRLYKELPRFPAVTRDIAFVAAKELPHQRILEVLGEANEPSLKRRRVV